MNFTFFNRNNGNFGELAHSGIAKILENYERSQPRFARPRRGEQPKPKNEVILAAMKKLQPGQYLYAGNLVITAVIGGISI